MRIAEAIAKFEGFGAAPYNRPTRNHNPGDIEYGPFASAHGATGSEGRFAVFPDDATGFEALRQLLRHHYQGDTVAQMMNKYAPSVENDTGLYITFLCQQTGLTPATVIDDHI